MKSGINSVPRVGIVDALRVIGILLVVWYHLWIHSWLDPTFSFFNRTWSLTIIPSTGYIGVEFLLFISGFGLFYPYVYRFFQNKKAESLREYIGRRAIRILPSYYIALLAAVIFFTVESDPIWGSPLKHIVSHLTLTHIFFNGMDGSISAVFWTLGTEFQFYILFPFFAWFFLRKPFLMFLVMVFTAYIFRLFFLQHDFLNLSFYLRQAPAFLDIYASGMLCAYLLVFLRLNSKFFTLRKYLFTLACLLLATAYVGLLLLHSQYVQQEFGRDLWFVYFRFVLGMLLTLFVLAVEGSGKLFQLLFINPVITYISTISYNLYLWHYMIELELKKWRIPDATTPTLTDDGVWQKQYFFLSLLLAFLVATVMTYCVEKPLIVYTRNITWKKLVRFFNIINRFNKS